MPQVCPSVSSPAITRTTPLENLAELVTVAEAAAWLGITRWTAYEMAKRGELPCVRIGRRVVRIPRAALASLINGPNPPAKG
jgi:excisionase family DNA binding protein